MWLTRLTCTFPSAVTWNTPFQFSPLCRIFSHDSDFVPFLVMCRLHVQGFVFICTFFCLFCQTFFPYLFIAPYLPSSALVTTYIYCVWDLGHVYVLFKSPGSRRVHIALSHSAPFSCPLLLLTSIFLDFLLYIFFDPLSSSLTTLVKSFWLIQHGRKGQKPWIVCSSRTVAHLWTDSALTVCTSVSHAAKRSTYYISVHRAWQTKHTMTDTEQISERTVFSPSVPGPCLIINSLDGDRDR